MNKIRVFECLEATTRVGKVRFNDETSAIYIEVLPGLLEYDIPLKRCRTAGAALDWIHQVNEKTWGPEVASDLLSIIFIVVPSSIWSGKA